MSDGSATATYRVQLTPDFGLREAAALVPYWRDLGISHLYSSPVLQARPGSTHGYDVVDHATVNHELGGERGLAELDVALRANGLQLLLDIVPNHMAISTPANRWWNDVLRSGRSSRFADFFDIDWDPPESKLCGRILVPVLPDHYGRVLDDGGFRIERRADGVVVTFGDLAFPLDVASLSELVQAVGVDLDDPGIRKLSRDLAALPAARHAAPGDRRRRLALEPRITSRLDRMGDDPRAAAAFDRAIEAVNADPERLDALLERQNFRLARWRTSGQEIDYRRFFDVDDLVGLRTERAEVFDAIHARIFEWADRKIIGGVRIDHVDGLADPEGYLSRLRERLPHAWILVEKILEPGESLRSGWPIDGTTGYEFGAALGGLFVDPAGEEALTVLHATFTGNHAEFDEITHAAKHEVMEVVLGAEVSRLTECFARVCEHRRRFRDFSRRELHEALVEVLACFRVYRTYVDDRAGASDEDLTFVEAAIDEAVKRRPDLDREPFDLLRRILVKDPSLEGDRERELRGRFQQVSPAVMAKSKEDTAFYRSSRLLALNEVGNDPSQFGVTPEAFHDTLAAVQRRWPTTMLALTTHDSKRTEDVRARLSVLSEMPDRWAAAVQRWHQHHADLLEVARIDAASELYLYQTVVGAHPISADRLVEHLRKAFREAKVSTSWLMPDEEFEANVAAFVEGIYADQAFQRDLREFVEPLVAAGRVNALAQKLVQLTAPGIPDLYQGQELWDLSLVDPDNRRPVDYERRRELLQVARTTDRIDVDLADPDEPGLAKMLVVQRALDVRRRFPAAFGPAATYEPIEAIGAHAARAVAFARSDQVVTVVPRLTLGMARGWQDTAVPMPTGDWIDVFDMTRTWSGSVALADLLDGFPVALLVRSPAQAGPDGDTVWG